MYNHHSKLFEYSVKLAAAIVLALFVFLLANYGLPLLVAAIAAFLLTRYSKA